MGFKSFIKTSFRYSFYAFLILLPFTFQAYIAGVLFSKWYYDGVARGIVLFTQEMDHFSYLNQWNVPGAPTIFEYQDDSYPFFVPQLHSNTWTSKLKLKIPFQHTDIFETDAPIDQLVSFERAVRDVSCHKGQPTEYWIYVSSLSMPAVFEWDRAFVQLLEYHEMHPLPDHKAFAYIDCMASPFLCHIWQVSYPALLHFQIDESAPLDYVTEEGAFEAPDADLRPLSVRIFDLGLQLDVSPLPPGVFPSEFEQMKALTSQPSEYLTVEEYNVLLRTYDRFHELYYDPACHRKGSFLYYSSEIDDFIYESLVKPIGLQAVMDRVAGVAFVTGVALSAFVHIALVNPLTQFWTGFFGEPTELDRLGETMAEREAFKEQGGIMGQAAWGFMDMLEERMASGEFDAAEQQQEQQQPAMTTQREAMSSALAAMRKNMSSILQGASLA